MAQRAIDVTEVKAITDPTGIELVHATGTVDGAPVKVALLRAELDGQPTPARRRRLVADRLLAVVPRGPRPGVANLTGTLTVDDGLA